jgi:SAM-dependent methyltransferase
MSIRYSLRELEKKVNNFFFRLKSLNKKKFDCPICGYNGPFRDVHPPTGLRKHAKCPNCGALERHRIQYVVIRELLKTRDVSSLRIIHFAPEPFFRGFFSAQFGNYESADLFMKDVDHQVDLQDLPFADETYDFVFASHVLEHIPDDEKAISEIRRILKPNGIAVLPVPLVVEKTVEYPEPNPYEAYHVRAPGLDYFDRYRRHFSKIELLSSDLLPDNYQLAIYEDRSKRPTKECPLLPAMRGERHIDIVPICYV